MRASQIGWGMVAWGMLAVLGPVASGQNVGAAPMGGLTVDQLVRMSPAALDQLYMAAGPAPMLSGRVPGRAIVFPGTALAGPASNAARLVWQGKVFRNESSTAVNRFFGVRSIEGKLYYAESWKDGRPSLILDYRETSYLYRRNRDEIRQVAPGIYLGLMYAASQPRPKFKMYFALQVPAS